MRLVILESPYGSPDPAVVEAHVEYARKCVRDCLERGDSPIASHLLYTQPGILNDRNASERAWGINAGLAWGKVAEASVVYVDRGVSGGMRLGIMRAIGEGRRVEFRALDISNTNRSANLREAAELFCQALKRHAA